MDEKHYKLSILPLFEDDLNEIVDYISVRLQNPIAAEDFVDAVETQFKIVFPVQKHSSHTTLRKSAGIPITESKSRTIPSFM